MSIFRPDGFLYRFISRFTSLVLLSLCWLVCCIPVVTIGAACTAMYSVCFKMIKDEDGHILRKFFAAFRRDFRQATLAWLILLPVGALILWVGYLYFFGMWDVSGAADFFAVVILILAAVYLVVMTYVFAVASRYENTAVQTIKNGLFIGLRYIGRTIILAAITLTVVFVCYWNYVTILFGVILAPGFLCYVHCSFIIRIFEKLECERSERAADEAVIQKCRAELNTDELKQ